MADQEHSLALFIDFENLALGFQGARGRFDVGRVLKRMVEKGKIVVKKAYADWNRYSSYTEQLHEAAIELIQIPRRAQTGKNSADIRLCVDAMDLAYSKEHIDTFVVVSGDSDFSPLVSKLKELGKHVIGLGMQPSTSELLRDNCDEFIYYEDVEAVNTDVPKLDPQMPELKKKAHTLLMEAMTALRRENKVRLWSSMIKDTMKRLKPSFNETYHGYSTFSALLEDAQQLGLLELETDDRSGTYVVTRFGDELTSPSAETGETRSRSRSRNRSRRGGPSRDRESRREGAPEETPADHGAPSETADLDDREPRRSRTRRRSGLGPRAESPVDPKLPPETFDEEFLPWPEE
ncbi:MAG: NYN domain-containing protein [Planctomycetaceae bacterium]|jgi:uncharacterized protein (TIGR00288 family)